MFLFRRVENIKDKPDSSLLCHWGSLTTFAPAKLPLRARRGDDDLGSILGLHQFKNQYRTMETIMCQLVAKEYW